MNPNDETDRTRLSKAVDASYKGMEWLRNLTRGLVEGYAGSGYGKPGKPRHQIIMNLMNQTVDAYTMALVANRPRVLLSSQIPERAYFAKHFGVAINSLIQEIGLEFVLRNWVLDAFFGLGVVKVHMADAGLVEIEAGRWMDPGRPCASNVSIDNFVFDLTANRWDLVKYAGDCYRIPHSDLSHPMYDPAVVAEISPSSKTPAETERIESIAKGDTTDDDELEPMVDLADIWIPRTGRIWTFPIERRGSFIIKGKPIADMAWDGSERGPYPILGFNDVPDNIIPTSMAAQLQGIFQLVNNILRKQARQAMRQKDVHTFTAAGKDDAMKIQKAEDGAFINVNDPKEIGLVQMGGVNPTNQAFAVSLVQVFDRMAGNLTAMMGLGAQTPTASQEQLIAGKVANKESQMQYRVLDASSRLIRDLGFMLWNDQAKVIPNQIPVEGTPYSVDGTWMPGQREGSFFDYSIDIDVSSMAYQPPAQRWQTISQFVTQVYAPLAQQFAAQGGQLNLQEFTELAATLLNTPQLKQCVQFANPLPGTEDDGGEQASGPTNTTRSYERRSVSAGPTPQNQAQMTADNWLNMASERTGAMRGNPV